MHCPRCKADCCQGHTFSLRSDRSNTYYKQNIQVSLCPKLDKYVSQHPGTENTQDTLSPPSTMTASGTPPLLLWKWTRFVCHYPELHPPGGRANALGATKEGQRGAGEQAGYCKLVLTQLVPRPSHKNKYCSVCKSNYDDYLEVTDDSLSTSEARHT